MSESWLNEEDLLLTNNNNVGSAVASAPGVAGLMVWNVGNALPTAVSTETFTRSTVGYQTLSTGIMESCAINSKRSSHYIGGVRTLLMEAARTNSFLNSNLFTGAPVTLTNMTATAAASTGPDNVASSASTVRETAASANHIVARTLFGGASMTAATTKLALTIWIKPTSGRTNVRFRVFDTGNYDAWFNLTGASAAALSVSNATAMPFTWAEALTNGWYRVTVTFFCQGTAVGGVQISPSTNGSTINHLGVITEGFDAFNMQEEDITAGTVTDIGSSCIITAGSAVTRTVDTLYWTLTAPWVPQAFTVYSKYVNLDYLANTGAIGVVGQHNGSGTQPHWSLMRWSDTTSYLSMESSFGAQKNTLNVGAPAPLDTVEQRGYMNATAQNGMGFTLNGGAETTAALAASAGAYPGAWSGDRIYLGNSPGMAGSGCIGFIRVAIHLGSDQTMATMRSLV